MAFWNEDAFSKYVNFKADPVLTPNLDKFAKESLVLTSTVSTCPLSSPHRGMLLTGMYPENNGVVLNCMAQRPESSLKESAITISDVFSGAGYDCAYLGKYHLDFPTKNNPQNPGTYVEARIPAWDAYTPKELRHGFNFWYSYGTFNEHNNPHYWDNDGNRHDPKIWSPEHEVDIAINYIKNVDKVRDTDKPFFMVISMNPPHSPYKSLEDCKEEDYNIYKDKTLEELLIRPNVDHSMDKTESAPYYFANITGVDREFGRLLEALKEAGLDENTVVVFSSDHGETLCSQGINDAKNSIYTESFNVPFIIRYPKHIEPKVDNLLLGTTDVMPTLIAIAGLKESIPETVQGTDYSSIFLNQENQVERPTAALYLRNVNGPRKDKLIQGFIPQSRGVKTDRYTLAIRINPKMEVKETIMFDDKKDPYQMNNLDIEENKELFAKLSKELAVVLQGADDIWYREKILDNIIPYNN